MIAIDINLTLTTISGNFFHDDPYEIVLEQAKKICEEFEFLSHVFDASLLPFELHFELPGNKESKTIQTDEFEKKLFGFYWHNREETFKSDESQIARLLFKELETRRSNN